MHRALNQQWIKDVCLQSAQKDKTESVARAMVGFLKPNELAQFIASRPLRIEMHAVRLLEGKLGELHIGNLQQLARKYDPCGRLVTAFARRRRVVARRCIPVSPKDPTATRCKYTSCAELNALLLPQPTAPRGDSLSYLLLFFVKILIELASRRQNDCLHADLAAQLLSRVAEKAIRTELPSGVHRQTVRRPVACQERLVAAIRGDGFVQTLDADNAREAKCEQASSVQPDSQFNVFRTMGIAVLSLACGAEHTVAITTDGVYGWGSSSYGQLGIGTVQRTEMPTRVPEFCCIDIACGHYHTLAITEDGRLWTWGRGTQGQLGTGTCDDATLPSMVTALAGLNVLAAAGGQAHSLVLTSDGDVYSFGCSSYGQLGTGDMGAMRPWPTPLAALEEPVRLIAAHSFHNVAVTESNVMYTWGVSPALLEEASRCLQASRDLRMDGCDYETISFFLAAHSKPRKVSAPVAGTIAQISCTAQLTIALTSKGQLYAWGADVTKSQRLQAARPTSAANLRRCATPSSKSPEEEQPEVAYVACSSDFCVALDERGRLLAWGKGSWLTNKQDKDASAAEGVFLPQTCELLDPANVDMGTQRRSSLSTNYGHQKDDLARLDAVSENGILDITGQAAYNLHLIPCVAKLYGSSFPMAASQAALAKQGALDVIAGLLLVQEEHEKAFHYHLEALLSCKHHTTSAFTRVFASTVDVYRRLILVANQPHNMQDLYQQLLTEAVAFASSHGIKTEELLQLHAATAVPSTPPTTPLAAPAASPSPVPKQLPAATCPNHKRLANAPRPVTPAKHLRAMTPTERPIFSEDSDGNNHVDEYTNDDTGHHATEAMPLSPKAQPTLAIARLWCNRSLDGQSLPQPQPDPRQALPRPDPRQKAYHLEVACNDRYIANVRECISNGPGTAATGCSGTRTIIALASTHSAANDDDMPTDLSMKGRRTEHPGLAEMGLAPATATAAQRCCSSDTVEFCCGHSFLRQAYVSTVLPRFLVTASRSSALRGCSRMMMDMYQRTDICALACPDCVASAIARL